LMLIDVVVFSYISSDASAEQLVIQEPIFRSLRPLRLSMRSVRRRAASF
jgi:hypothetical protein